MELELIIGLIAGSLTTIAFLPQLIKTVKTRSAKDVSLLMFAGFTAGVVLWLIYGIMIGDLPVILFNSITSVLAGLILYFKLKYG